MTITAAADGSSLGNPGPTGWAWFIDETRWSAGGFAHGTNNIGELTAVAELLDATAGSAEPLLILCDSKYVIDSLTKWLPGWKRSGWKKRDGKPVQNLELMQRLDRALAGREVRFQWVKGHNGHPENEAADVRARAAASAFASGRRPEVGPGYGGSNPAGLAAGAERAADSIDVELGDAGPELALWDAATLELEAERPSAAQDVLALTDEFFLAREGRRRAVLDGLLADDYREITASGRVLDRDRALSESGSALRSALRQTVELGSGVILARIWGSLEAQGVVVTAIWTFSPLGPVDGAWQLRQLQLTPER